MRYRLTTFVSFFFSALFAVVLVTGDVCAQSLRWAVQLGGGPVAFPNDVTVDAAGVVYTVGSFQGTADFDPGSGTFNLTSAGNSDAFISKLDGNGKFVWAGRMGGSFQDGANGVVVDSSGSVYITGGFLGTADFDPGPGVLNLTSFGADAFVCKLDSAGALVWARKLGGTSTDGADSVAVDAAGNVYTVGVFQGTADFDPGPGTFELTADPGSSDAFVSKLDQDGNFVWAGRLGGIGSQGFVKVVEAQGNLYMAGSFNGVVDCDPGPGSFNLTSTNQDVLMVKLDSAGGLVWAKSFTGAEDQGSTDMVVDGNHGIHVSGQFRATADFDPGPGTFNLTSAGDIDAFVCKLDSAGNFVWARRLGGVESESAQGVEVDDNGSVWSVGYFRATADFDPGPGTFDLTPSGSFDSFLSKLDRDGNFVWAGRWGGLSSNIPHDLAGDAAGNVFAAGSFFGAADFDPGPSTSNLTAGAATAAFVSKIAGCGFFTDESNYGTLVFAPRCTRSTIGLTQTTYESRSLTLFRGPGDEFFLSSKGNAFAPLVVDDVVQIAGQDAALGPYEAWPGMPPFRLNAPIEHNLVPLPPHDVTALIPAGQGMASFELLDTRGEIYGNTAVYLVRDCGIQLDDASATVLHFVTHDDEVAGTPPEFDVRHGLLSELRADWDFSRAACLGRFSDTPAIDALPDPPAADGRYYLGRGLSSCVAQGHGDSSLTPDPRDALDALPSCP